MPRPQPLPVPIEAPRAPLRPLRPSGSDLPLALIGKAATGEPERALVRHDGLPAGMLGAHVRARERSKAAAGGMESSGSASSFGPLRKAIKPVRTLRTAVSQPHSLSSLFHQSHSATQPDPTQLHVPPLIAPPTLKPSTPVNTAVPAPTAPAHDRTRISASRRSTRAPRRRRHSLPGSVMPSPAVQLALQKLLANEPLRPLPLGNNVSPPQVAPSKPGRVKRKPVPRLTSGDWMALDGRKSARGETALAPPVPVLGSPPLSAFDDATESGGSDEAIYGSEKEDEDGPPGSATSHTFSSMSSSSYVSRGSGSTIRLGAVEREPLEELHPKPALRSYKQGLPLSLHLPSPSLEIDFGTPDTEIQTPSTSNYPHGPGWGYKHPSEWRSGVNDTQLARSETAGGLFGLGLGSVGNFTGPTSADERRSGETEAFELDDLVVRRSPILTGLAKHSRGQAEQEDIEQFNKSTTSDETARPDRNEERGYWDTSIDLGYSKVSLGPWAAPTAKASGMARNASGDGLLGKDDRSSTYTQNWINKIRRISRSASPVPPKRTGAGHYIRRSQQLEQSSQSVPHKILHQAIFGESPRAEREASQKPGPNKNGNASGNGEKVTPKVDGSNACTSPLKGNASEQLKTSMPRPTSSSTLRSSLALSDIEEIVAFGPPAVIGTQISSTVHRGPHYSFPAPPSSNIPSDANLQDRLQVPSDAASFRPEQQPQSSLGPPSVLSGPLTDALSPPSSPSARKVHNTKRSNRNTFGLVNSWFSARSTATVGTAPQRQSLMSMLGLTPAKTSGAQDRAGTSQWSSFGAPPLPQLSRPPLAHKDPALDPIEADFLHFLRSNARRNIQLNASSTVRSHQASLTTSGGLHLQPSVDNMSVHSNPSTAATHARVESPLLGAHPPASASGTSRGGTHRSGSWTWTCGCCS